MEEAKACVKKYFNEASVDINLLSLMRGIKDNKLISNPIQALYTVGMDCKRFQCIMLSCSINNAMICEHCLVNSWLTFFNLLHSTSLKFATSLKSSLKTFLSEKGRRSNNNFQHKIMNSLLCLHGFNASRLLWYAKIFLCLNIISVIAKVIQMFTATV
uniref:Uncharacterized protein n=1 Tax=Glossina brevipalpis TaxID=37001 RepID=A0A1A9WJW4_9MUSC